jgi:ABC-type branched-subunit amino acid transport system substrate-binding protein
MALVLGMALGFLPRPGNAAEPTGKPIPLGMSTALSGPAQFLGQEMRSGVQAALDEANHQGGIQGRPLRLIVLDDGYEPAKTGPNMHRLIEQEEVVAVIGNVGTPTAVVAAPICNATKTLLFGAFSGAGVLRKTPPDRYVVNYRASYAEETGAMVDALMAAGLRPTEVAFFTQRDAFGDAGYSGGIVALRRHGLKDETEVAHGRFERNTLAVEGALADILSAPKQPRAVIMVGPYAPCSEFIRLARGNGLNGLFLNVSFVGSGELADKLGAQGEGVIVTQVVPHFESDLPLVKEYRTALATSDRTLQPTFTSLEGYVSARILLRAMGHISGPIDREAIVRSLEDLGQFDLGLSGPLRLSAQEHQASHCVWPTVIRQGNAVRFDWSELKTIVQ